MELAVIGVVIKVSDELLANVEKITLNEYRPWGYRLLDLETGGYTDTSIKDTIEMFNTGITIHGIYRCDKDMVILNYIYSGSSFPYLAVGVNTGKAIRKMGCKFIAIKQINNEVLISDYEGKTLKVKVTDVICFWSDAGLCNMYAEMVGKDLVLRSIDGTDAIIDTGGIDDINSAISKATILSQGMFNIEKDSVHGCMPQVKNVILPYGIRRVHFGAFHTNLSVDRLIACDTLRVIEDNAFYCCTELRTVKLNNGLLCIGDFAFTRTKIKSINIPDTVVEIGRGAFYRCDCLEEVKLSEGIRKIGSQAFTNTMITEITLPSTLIEIGHGAFSGCPLLKKIICKEKIPNGLDANINIGIQVI